MAQRHSDYRVGELAALSGVSVRTLHHYDRLGLLRPAHVGANGYRTYGRGELVRLQEILLLRAMGMGLAEIRAALASDEGRLQRLRRHRMQLRARADGLVRMMATLEATIAELEGGAVMADKALYEGFSTERQGHYEDWLEARGFGAAVAHAKAGQMGTGPVGAGPGDWAAGEAPLVQMYRDGVTAGSADCGAALEAHRALVARFWRRDCDAAAYAGLADLYAHPDFVARYEALAAGFSTWLPQAMRAHALRLEKSGATGQRRPKGRGP